MWIFLKIIKDKAQNLGSGDEPIYSITKAANLLNIHPRTLMKYEKYGLLKPTRNSNNGRRLYSKSDIKWIACIATLIHEDGFSIKILNHMLNLVPCWILKQCSEEVKKECTIHLGRAKTCWGNRSQYL